MKPLPLCAVEAGCQLGVLGVASAVAILAEVSVSDGAVTGGVVGGIVVVGGALVSWWLRYRKESVETRATVTETDLKAEERRAALERKQRKDALDEWRQTVLDLRADREADRKLIHDLRDEFNAEKLKHVVTQSRLDACEADRQEMRERIEGLEGGGRSHD